MISLVFSLALASIASMWWLFISFLPGLNEFLRHLSITTGLCYWERLLNVVHQVWLPVLFLIRSSRLALWFIAHLPKPEVCPWIYSHFMSSYSPETEGPNLAIFLEKVWPRENVELWIRDTWISDLHLQLSIQQLLILWVLSAAF